jgi:hypothetical protein
VLNCAFLFLFILILVDPAFFIDIKNKLCITTYSDLTKYKSLLFRLSIYSGDGLVITKVCPVVPAGKFRWVNISKKFAILYF